MSTAPNEIERILGGRLPPGFAALSEADLESLATAIREATHNQEAALATAIDNGLTIVPRLLRGTVRKALFG